VGRVERLPGRLVCATHLPAKGNRKVPNDLNPKAKTKTKRKTSMNSPKIIAYLKPTCGWSQGVRSIMRKYTLAYEDRDVINNRALYQEMVQKSGQGLSPCVEIDGHMLADVSGDEVEAYLLKAGVVQPTVVAADAPTNQACDAHHHE
jgi:monothiol glutaredoxin